MQMTEKFSEAELKLIRERKLANQELSLQEYADRKIVLKSKPSKVLVELTQNCNFRCKMCPQSWEPKFERHDPALNMPLELIEKVARELFADAHLVDLRGVGETTILPYWPEVVDRLEDYPLVNWHLVTNLSLSRQATWEKMIRNGFILGFSCDAADKQTFEAIRARSKFEAIARNLETVTGAIKDYGRGYLYFITVVQRANRNELPRLVELAHAHGVKEIQLKRALEVAPYFTDVFSDSERGELAESLERGLKMAVERAVRVTINDQELLALVDPVLAGKAQRIPIPALGIGFTTPAALDDQIKDKSRVSVHQQCFKPFHYTTVGYDGAVGPCNHLVTQIIEMGSLKTQSFDEIWNGERYQFFRGSLLYAKPLDARCQWCFKHRLED